MKSLVGGVVLAVAGAILTFFGLAMILGWQGGNLIQAIPITAVGALLIGLGGNLQRPNIPLAYGVAGGACLITAFLVATEVPQMINAGSGADALQLWCLMCAGIMLFFGLSAIIASVFSYLLTKG